MIKYKGCVFFKNHKYLHLELFSHTACIHMVLLVVTVKKAKTFSSIKYKRQRVKRMIHRSILPSCIFAGELKVNTMYKSCVFAVNSMSKTLFNLFFFLFLFHFISSGIRNFLQLFPLPSNSTSLTLNVRMSKKQKNEIKGKDVI